MNKFNLLVIILAFFIFGQSFAQNFDQISVTDPNTASFQKFIDFPVNPYNGTTDISIPVYHLKDGAVDIPIVLRYNTSGIKVAEEASWVGLGWNLDVGGSIIHSFDGEPDSYGDYQSAKVIDMKTNGDTYYCALFYNQDPRLTSSQYMSIEKVKTGFLRPDLYSFSIPGASGKFVIDYWDDSNGSDGVAKLMNKSQNIDIQKTGNGLFRDWIITDENGTKYFFNTLSSHSSNASNSGTTGYTYYLSSIEYPNGQEVLFVYNDFVGRGRAVSTVSGSNSSGLPPQAINYEVDRGQMYEFDNIYLQYIITKNYTIEFKIKDRIDIYEGKALDKIVVHDKTKIKERTFKFETGYFTSGSYDSKSYYTKEFVPNEDIIKKRLRLDAFGEEGIPSYKFNYNSGELPPKTSYAVDYWGFYNGEITNESLMPNINHIEMLATYFSSEGLPVLMRENQYTGNRAFNEEYADGWLLKSIENSLGGLTEYKFEPNEFVNFPYPTIQQIHEFTPGEPGDTPTADISDYNKPDATLEDISYQFNFNAPIKVKIVVIFNRGKSPSGTFQEMQDSYARLGHYTTELHKWTIKTEYLNEEPYLRYELDTILEPTDSYGYSLSVGIPNDLGDQSWQGSDVFNDMSTLLGKQMNVRAYIYFAPVPTSYVCKGAGYRVREIIHYPVPYSDNEIIRRVYSYPSGTLMSPLKFHQIYKDQVYPLGENVRVVDDYSVSSSSYIPTSFNASGSLVGYSIVEIKELASIHQSAEDNIKGKIRLQYHNYVPSTSAGTGGNFNLPTDHSDFFNLFSKYPYFVKDLPNIPIIDNYINGKLNIRTAYDKDDNPIKTQVYSYKLTANIGCINGMISRDKNYTRKKIFGTNDLFIDLDENLTYYYPIRTGGYVLDYEMDHDIQNNTMIERYYNYNNYDQLISISSENSKGLSTETIYKYPQDYNPPLLENNPSCEEDVKAISKMVENNMFNYPVEVSKLIDGKLVESNYTEYYNYADNKVMPKKSFKIVNTGPLDISPMPMNSDFTPSFLSHDKKRIDKDNFYPEAADIEIEYDNEGRVVQRTLKNNSSISYLWGYNNTLPIAIVVGKTYSELETAISNAGLSLDDLKKTINLQAGVAMNDETLRTNINRIRDFLPGAQITSYTYTPLYGVTSKTDANKEVTYYEYDDFGRLLRIKDAENKILKEYKYHYAKE